MSLGLIMKLFHVFAAFGLIAGAVGRNIAFGQAAKTANLHAILALLQLRGRLENPQQVILSCADDDFLRVYGRS